MKTPAAITISILIILFSLTACQGAGSVFKNLAALNLDTAQNQQQAINSGSAPDQTGNSEESPPDSSSNPDTGNASASLFDYTAIKIDTTKSLDIEIENCDVYLDIDGDLLILGEIANSSLLYKTNVEITFDFYDSKGEILDSQKVKTIADYILPGKRFPFSLIYDKRAKYIDISKIKIGVNYKNYNESFEGFPVVTRKNFYYIDDMMVTDGNISNIGGKDIEDLKLVGVFYNYKNQVVFLKECYLADDKLSAGQSEDFVLKILLDEYTPQFTHFNFEAAFRDTLKV
jgi:hypothetical protein